HRPARATARRPRAAGRAAAVLRGGDRDRRDGVVRELLDGLAAAVAGARGESPRGAGGAAVARGRDRAVRGGAGGVRRDSISRGAGACAGWSLVAGRRGG